MQITLLYENKTIKQLVEKDTNESILELLNKELQSDNYNFVITADNVPFAKKQMAELNKTKDFIDTFRKNKVAAESKDIDAFKLNNKAYIKLFEDKYNEIKKNVEVFQQEKKDSITKELSLYADNAIKEACLRYDFTNVDTADLIVFGSVTAKGNLTKKATETIDGRVAKCKASQDKYDMRLLKLENESHKAGLESPLTITHVQGIIMLDDDSEYEEKLKGLISSEIERQNTIKANIETKAKEDAEREAQQKVLNEQNSIKAFYLVQCDNFDLDQTDSKLAELSTVDYSVHGDYVDFARSFVGEQISKLTFHRNNLLQKANDLLADMESKQNLPPKKEIEVVHETIPKDTPKVEDGKKIVKVKAMFDILVPSGVNDDQVINVVNKKLSAAGITSDSLKSLEVVQ